MTIEDFQTDNLEPFEDALNTIDDLDMDADDLAEWLNGQLESGFEELNEPTANDLLKEPLSNIKKNMFDDERFTLSHSSRRRASRSPPRRRTRLHSPQRTKRTKEKNRQVHMQATTSSRFIETMPENSEYNEALSKLAESMKRSELSRLASARTSPQPSASTLSSLTGLLSGKRTSLTAGLEHSRRQLRAYMSLMIANQTM